MNEYDNTVQIQEGFKLCHLPEKLYIHTLHQSGHIGMPEEADTSYRIMEKFFPEPSPEEK